MTNKFECHECGKSFESERGLRSHKNHHNPEYHAKSAAGGRASQLKATEARVESIRVRYAELLDEYNRNPNKCEHCGSSIKCPAAKMLSDIKSRKYCSRSCSSIASKSKKVYIKKPRKPSSKRSLPQEERSCVICKNIFMTHRCGKVKTCSKPCTASLVSKSLNSAIENGYNPQKHRGRSKRSYMEESFSKWLNTFELCPVWLEEHPIKIVNEDGSYKTTYFIDFYFPQLKIGIELDGSQHKGNRAYDAERDRQILEHHGITIYRISHTEYRKKIKVDMVKSLLGL